MDRINELIEQLNLHTTITGELCALTSEVQEAITEGNIKSLDRLVKLQSSVIMKYSVSEKKIMDLFLQIKRELGITSDQICISDLNGYIDSISALKLNQAKDGFLESYKNLSKTNMDNQMLLENKLDLIDYTLKLLEQNGYESKSVIDDYI